MPSVLSQFFLVVSIFFTFWFWWNGFQHCDITVRCVYGGRGSEMSFVFRNWNQNRLTGGCSLVLRWPGRAAKAERNADIGQPVSWCWRRRQRQRLDQGPVWSEMSAWEGKLICFRRRRLLRKCVSITQTDVGAVCDFWTRSLQVCVTPVQERGLPRIWWFLSAVETHKTLQTANNVFDIAWPLLKCWRSRRVKYVNEGHGGHESRALFKKREK